MSDKTLADRLRKIVNDKDMHGVPFILKDAHRRELADIASALEERAERGEEKAWDFLADWWSSAPAGGILLVRDTPEFYAHLRTHKAKIEGEETDVLVIAEHEHPLNAILAMMRGESSVPHPPESTGGNYE